tara:strand:- start:3111 stop:3779 length:669 start_codon:yes stop_codon:yes gene_type:complete
MLDFTFLTVTNSPFVPIVEKLLTTLNEYHPDITVHVVCVNMTGEEIRYMRSLHKNINTIAVRKKFKKFGGDRKLGPKDKDHEEGYCTSCRSWFMLDIMKKRNKSVFYLDADVFLKGPIDDLFPSLEDADFMIRSKNLDPKMFKCNAGMVWVKNTPLNRELVTEWAKKTINMGISWRSNQWTLDELIRENWDRIKYRDFPLKFNGKTNNPETILVHMKGLKNV